MRFTWMHVVILALGGFIVFITTLVLRIEFSKNNFDLVSENYYQDELNYQQEIDASKRAANLSTKPIIEINKDKGIIIKFPKSKDTSPIQGMCLLQHPSNKALDIVQKINFGKDINKEILIRKNRLLRSYYYLKLTWKQSNISYQIEQKNKMELNSLFIFSALGLGLFSSFHCAGMCGPIALSLGLNPKDKLKFILKNLSYQLGRTVSYTFMGLLTGLLSGFVSITKFQNLLSIVSGILLLMIVLFQTATFTTLRNKNSFAFFYVKLKQILAINLRKRSMWSKFATGLVNGFLPCGVVYMALAGSLASSNILNSVLFMFCFGLGTIPMMFIMVFSGHLISIKLRQLSVKIFPAFVAVIGILFILRGFQINPMHLLHSRKSHMHHMQEKQKRETKHGHGLKDGIKKESLK